MTNPFHYRYVVAEDEHLIRQNTIKKITALNLPVELAGAASNGQEALQLIEEFHPHFIITDIKMPVMNGIDLAQKIHELYPHIKVIILSGYNDFAFAQQAIRFGVKDFLLKPVSVESLTTCLQELLITLDATSKAHTLISANTHTLSKEEIANITENYLRENYKKDISLGNLADKLGFSQDYISRTFKKYKNDSPIKYITKLRINEAKHLLLHHQELDIKSIGEAVGYPDPFYFSRVFKTNVGVYPSEFRIK